MMSRTGPPASQLEHNVRKANTQPRLLRAACIVLEPRSTTDRTSAGARVTTDKVVVVVAVTAERSDEEAGAAAGSRDNGDIGECQGRAVCQSQGYIHWRRTVDMRVCWREST
jgi:hypothetical protein